jgi:hypothetical protein
MKAAIVDKKIECGVHSLPGWMQEMLAERMDRFVKAEREATEQNGREPMPNRAKLRLRRSLSPRQANNPNALTTDGGAGPLLCRRRQSFHSVESRNFFIKA